MISRSTFSILHRIKMERKRQKSGDISQSININRKKNSICEVVDLMNKDNISHTLNTRVQNSLSKLRKSTLKMRDTLAAREKSLEDLTKKYVKEKLILKEELYRKLNFPTYSPTDYVFQLYGEVDPRSNEIIDESEKNQIFFDHFKSNERTSEMIKPLTSITEELREMKMEFLRKKTNTVKELGNKAVILQMCRKRLNEKTRSYQKKLEILRSQEEKNEKKENELSKREDEVLIKNEDLSKKKKKLKKLKREFQDNADLQRYLRKKEYSGKSFYRRKQIKKLDKTYERQYQKNRIMKSELNKERDIQLRFQNLEIDLLRKKEEICKEVETSKKEIESLELERKRRYQIIKLRKEKETREKQEKKRLSKKKQKKNKIKKKKKKKKEKEKVFIPDLEVPKSILNVDGKIDEEEENNKKEIREVANQVSKFKKDFTSLFDKIDVVKARMDFYSSTGTGYLSTPGSARVLNRVGPKGKVAIVMTDVQNSTHLWERDSKVMRTSMGLHNDVTRKILESTKGYEIRTEGDAFICAFGKVNNALRFALSLQTALTKVEWPKSLYGDDSGKIEKTESGRILFKGLRVRIGIHYGNPIIEKDSVTGRDDYFGPMVNKTGLIESQGKGGVIAISEEVFRSIRGFFGSDQDRELQEKKLGCRVFLKLLGFKKLTGKKKRELVRWIIPYDLRERFKLVLVSHKSGKNEYKKMTSIVSKLKERQKQLDRERNKIHSKLNFQIRLKSLESSNSEKENVISYLKKKLQHIKGTYEKALEGRKNPFLEEEQQLRRDLETVMEKYNRMNGMYADLKKNFDGVEKVFQNRLKNELERFQLELDEVTKKLSINQSRSRFNRQVWKIEKDVLLKKSIDQLEIVKNKENVILKLDKELRSLEEKKEELITEKQLGGGIIDTSNISNEELEIIIKNLEDDDERKEKKKVKFSSSSSIDNNSKIFEGSQQIINKEEFINIGCSILHRRRRLEKEEEKEIYDKGLPFLGSDDLIIGNTNLYSTMSKKRQEEMINEDLSKLMMIQKILKYGSTDNDKLFQKLILTDKITRSKYDWMINNNSSIKNNNNNNKKENKRCVFLVIQNMSNKKRIGYIKEQIEEIKKKYKNLRDANLWQIGIKKIRIINERIGFLNRCLNNCSSSSTFGGNSRILYNNNNNRNPFLTPSSKIDNNNICKSGRKIRPHSSSTIFNNIWGSSSNSNNTSPIIIKKRRKKNKVKIPKRILISDKKIPISYSRLLQKLPIIATRVRDKGGVSDEKNSILTRLYYDRNAKNYSHIL